MTTSPTADTRQPANILNLRRLIAGGTGSMTTVIIKGLLTGWATLPDQSDADACAAVRVQAGNTVALGGVRVRAAASHQSQGRGHMTK